jgi:hypothetical protein
MEGEELREREEWNESGGQGGREGGWGRERGREGGREGGWGREGGKLPPPPQI